MRILISLAICISANFIAVAQTEVETIHKEINDVVWKPFMQAYNQFDYEAFNSLHTHDVIRVTPHSIRLGEEYKLGNQQNFMAGQERNMKWKIEIAHVHRLTRPELSYEVGYYKVTIETGGEESFHYGRFHVVIKKVDGQWKIAQDWDTDQINGINLSEEDFLTGIKIQ